MPRGSGSIVAILQHRWPKASPVHLRSAATAPESTGKIPHRAALFGSCASTRESIFLNVDTATLNAVIIAAGPMMFHSRRRKYGPWLSTSMKILIWLCGSISCWSHCSCKACYDKWCSHTEEYQQSSSVYSQMSCI